ncbi:MAG: response regulator [Candidatus Gastranaerophilales bacterium]|nr:response regulator [Candidatus Gastranaerophilales bacterium]
MAKKLVIIDDSSTQLNILKTLFTNCGWEVCGVQNAKIGYEIIFDFAPDLIITDAIMPLMGGFQLVKQIRENPIISRIPVIVYSVLDESNAKFYINEELSEYFLKKDDNHHELLNLAEEITNKFPLEKEYKDEILRAGLENYKQIQQAKIQNIESVEETEQFEEIEILTKDIKENFNIDALEKEVKKIYDFTLGDEKIFSKLYQILNSVFRYDLAVIGVYSFSNKERRTYFDIRNIILSPILKNSILAKKQTKIGILYKKYAPNLTTIVNESEFFSKIELDFEYKNEQIAQIDFYSQEKMKWENFENIKEVKEILYDFFKTRYIQKTSQVNSKDEIKVKYKQMFNKFGDIKNTHDSYFSIIQISNYSDLIQNLSFEDVDILNLKLSEKFIECLEKDEQVYKSDEGEYSVVLFAKDEKQARHRFEYIIKEINEISYNANYVNGVAFASSCNIEGAFNIVEAQKNVKKLIEEANYQESVIIYNEQ